MTRAEEVNMLENELRRCSKPEQISWLKHKIALIIEEASEEEQFFDKYGTTN